MAKISVIVPIYNVEKYLKKCLDSIIKQTFKDLEIILVNDGSKDKSLEILNEYAAKDSRIVVIDKPNGGYGSACNVGLDKATGEYVAIVEPDDFIKRTMYEDLYNLSQEYDVDVVKSCFYIAYDTKKLKKIKKENLAGRFKIPENVFTIFDCPELLNFHPSIWSAIYKRKFLNKNKIRFIEAPGSGWTDNPFRVAVYCSGAKIIYTDRAYYFWRNLHLNIDAGLSDITVPYKRSVEIHNWLKQNNINDKDVITCLYKLELVYIYILLKKIRINNYIGIKKEIKNLLSIIDSDTLLNNKYVLPIEKKVYTEMNKNLDRFFLKFFLKNQFSTFFSIKNELKLYFLIHKNRNVVLWGASLFLEQFIIKYFIGTKNIIGIVDRNESLWGTNIGKYKIYSPEFLNENKNCNVIMTISNFNQERYLELENLFKEQFKNAKLFPNVFE